MTRFGLVVLPLAVAYAGTFRWIWESWWLEESFYSHGPLVPVVAALAVWLWRGRWRRLALGSDGRGWLLLGPGLLVHLAGAGLTIDSLSAASLLLTVPGAAVLAFGGSRVRSVWPALAVLVFAIPLPMFVTGRIAFELKELAVETALALGNGLGLGAERAGARILVPGQETALHVADPCSGLRSLVALTTIGYCVAFFVGPQRGPRRWVILLAAMPIAVFTNIARITATCFIARDAGVAYATGPAHDVLGYSVFVVDLALLLAIDAMFFARRRGSG